MPERITSARYAGPARRGLVGWVASLAWLAVTLLGSVLGAPRGFPPNFAVVASFIAAALLSVRSTITVALLATAQTVVVAHYLDDYRGWPLIWRVVFAVTTSAVAVALAVARSSRERQLQQAHLDLATANLLRTLADTSADPIFVKDRDGRYLLANDATAIALGLDHGEQLIGRRDRDFVPSEVADWIEADDQRVFRSGGREEFEDTLERPDGQQTYLTHKAALRDEDGFVVGLTAVSKDITVRRQTQRELQRSEHRFRSLVEATSAVVWRASPALEFLEPQPGWSAYTAQRDEEQQGRGWLRALHADDREGFLSAALGSTGASPFEVDCRLWHAPSRQFRYVSARGVPIVEPGGEVREWIGTFADTHDRVVAEQQMERLAAARRLVAEAASRVAVAADEQRIAREALQVLTDHLPPHSASVVMTESEHPERWRAIAFTGVRAALASEWQSFRPDVRVPAHDVVVSGRSLEFGDAEAYRRAYPDLADAIDASGMRGQSFLVPLTAGSRCLGTLTLSYRERVDDAQAESTRLTLQELAPVIGHSVSQAQFLELEARIASSFQEAMLELRREPDPRLDVATFYLAGSVLLEAGGDWYDVIDLPDGRIALTIGDVVGRSLRAATVMGRLRTAMRGLVLALQDPAEVLVALDALVDTIEDAPFSTCSCIVVDPSARQLTYANAGHPPALHVSERGEGVFLEAAQGPPLGVHGRQPRRSARHPFEVGGRLVLYTDGLVERRKEPLDLGLARLHDAVVRADGTMMENLPGAVARALFAEYEQRDDVAMICAELISESADRFHRVVEPDPMAIRTVRRRFGYWIGAGGADHKAAQDAVLALGEALANAVEHGGATRHSIEVEAVRRGELLELAVRDQGRWRDAEVDPSRGRGLQIMRHVADRVDIEAHESGTTVTLALPFGAPRAG